MNRTRDINKLHKKVVLGWWAFTILFISVFFLWGRLQYMIGVGTYFLLWLFFSLCCFFFSTRWSFSSRLGIKFDIFEIPNYVSFTSLILIGLLGLVPYFDENYLLHQLPSVDLLPKGLLLIGIGLICLWLGYSLVVVLYRSNLYKERRPRISFLDFGNPSLVRTLFLYCVIALLRVILFLSGGGEKQGGTTPFGVWNQWILYLVDLRWFFMPLFLLQVLSKKWPRLSIVFILGFELSMSLASGYASTLLKIGFLIIGCFIYTKQRIPLRLIFFLAFVFVFLTPITRYIRNMDRSSINSTVSSIEEGVNIYWGGGEEGISFAKNLFIERQSAIAQTPALLMTLTPEIIPYRPISEFVLIPFSIIPRVIWPSKPEYASLGGIITNQYFGLPISSGSSAPTFAGSAYLYGGWPIVIIAMFIIGVISAFFYKLVAYPAIFNNNLSLLAMYIGVVIFNFHIGEGDMLGLWQGMVQSTFVFYFVLLFLCIKNRALVPVVNAIPKKSMRI